MGALAIEGNYALSSDEIRAVISAGEGQPYSDSTVINDQTQVMDAYFNRGFSESSSNMPPRLIQVIPQGQPQL